MKDSKGYDIKLIDFGFSMNFKDNKNVFWSCGSPKYMAPELIDNKGKSYNEKIDIWAIGLMAYELVTGGDYPFSYLNVADLMK